MFEDAYKIAAFGQHAPANSMRLPFRQWRPGSIEKNKGRQQRFRPPANIFPFLHTKNYPADDMTFPERCKIMKERHEIEAERLTKAQEWTAVRRGQKPRAPHPHEIPEPERNHSQTPQTTAEEQASSKQRAEVEAERKKRRDRKVSKAPCRWQWKIKGFKIHAIKINAKPEVPREAGDSNKLPRTPKKKASRVGRKAKEPLAVQASVANVHAVREAEKIAKKEREAEVKRSLSESDSQPAEEDDPDDPDAASRKGLRAIYPLLCDVRTGSATFRALTSTAANSRRNPIAGFLGLVAGVQALERNTVDHAVKDYVSRLCNISESGSSEFRIMSQSKFSESINGLVHLLKEDTYDGALSEEQIQELRSALSKRLEKHHSGAYPFSTNQGAREAFIRQIPLCILRKADKETIDPLMIRAAINTICKAKLPAIIDHPGFKSHWNSICRQYSSNMFTTAKQGFQQAVLTACSESLKAMLDKSAVVEDDEEDSAGEKVFFAAAANIFSVCLLDGQYVPPAYRDSHNLVTKETSDKLRVVCEAFGQSGSSEDLHTRAILLLRSLMLERFSLSYIERMPENVTPRILLEHPLQARCSYLVMLPWLHAIRKRGGHELGMALVSGYMASQHILTAQ